MSPQINCHLPSVPNWLSGIAIAWFFMPYFKGHKSMLAMVHLGYTRGQKQEKLQ